LKANLAAQADEKQLELLFLQWIEHHTHLCSFLRTTAEPAIYFMPAKPSEETDKLLHEYQQGLEGWQFQQKSTDEQSFSTFPSDFVPLKPVIEGDHPKFSN
jgi:pinin